MAVASELLEYWLQEFAFFDWFFDTHGFRSVSDDDDDIQFFFRQHDNVLPTNWDWKTFFMRVFAGLYSEHHVIHRMCNSWSSIPRFTLSSLGKDLCVYVYTLFFNIGGDQGINQTNLKITTSGEQQARSQAKQLHSSLLLTTGRYFLLLWSSLKNRYSSS